MSCNDFGPRGAKQRHRVPYGATLGAKKANHFNQRLGFKSPLSHFFSCDGRTAGGQPLRCYTATHLAPMSAIRSCFRSEAPPLMPHVLTAQSSPASEQASTSALSSIGVRGDVRSFVRVRAKREELRDAQPDERLGPDSLVNGRSGPRLFCLESLPLLCRQLLGLEYHHDLLQGAGELERHLVEVGLDDRRSGVLADVEGLIERETHRDGLFDSPLCYLLPIDEEGAVSAFADAAS